MLSSILSAALVATRLHAALFAIIPDCDEVYNYWEPLNFLTRFFGKQTWEYSPEYAIRSYAYLIPYSLLIYPIRLTSYIASSPFINNYLPLKNLIGVTELPPYTLFYAIRILLALLFAIVEIKLSKSLRFLNKSIQPWFLLSQVVSPGMYQASISILPSSFTLLLGMISTKYMISYFNAEKLISSIDDELINIENKINISKDSSKDVDDLAPSTNMLLNLYRVSVTQITKCFTLVCLITSVAGFAGWPFAMVLIAPFITYSLYTSLTKSPNSVLKNNYSISKSFSIYLLAGIACLFFIAFFISQIDSIFYRKITYVAYNIMSYNVLNTSEASGPDIFGTEPSTWYLKNLLLNYHVLFIIAALNLLTIPNTYQLVIYKLPLLLWLAIFSSQPHKEERFMYPIYHLISISFAQFMSCETFNANVVFKLFKKILNIAIITSTIVLFLTRTNNINTNYSAPITLFEHLSSLSLTPPNTHLNSVGATENVCIGREWYHFPSSLFLAPHQRLRFTQSAFSGMLPADFPESPLGSNAHSFEALVNATSLYTADKFNNKNVANWDFVTSPEECDFYIDTTKETTHHDATSLASEEWEIVKCVPFIDADASYGIERVLNIAGFFDDVIVKPWLHLQEDLSVIELNRKLQQMAGVQNPDGNRMFDGMYEKLGRLQHIILSVLGDKAGELKTTEMCLAKRR